MGGVQEQPQETRARADIGGAAILNGLRILAIIPARGGSKSVPGKNLRLLGNKPLIVWSIEAARDVEAIDRVLVSTDDERIAEVAREANAEVYARPSHLATDYALVIETVRDLYGRLRQEGEESEIMVLLEPTCPFRKRDEVRHCLTLVAEGADSAATFRDASLNPHRAWRVVDGRPAPFIEGAIPWLPRQQLPPAYQPNGVAYAFRPATLPADSVALLFGDMRAVVTDNRQVVDIDTELDLVVAETILGWRDNE